MKIASSNVNGQSAHVSFAQKSTIEELDLFENGQLAASYRREKEETRLEQSGSLFLQGQKDAFAGQPGGLSGLDALHAPAPKTQRELLKELEEIKFKALQLIFALLRGGKAPFRNVVEAPGGALRANTTGFAYSKRQERCEYERMDFEMKGKAVTEDGRSIHFDVSLSMSREFYESVGFTAAAGDRGKLSDPLVVQLSGAPSLTDAKFSFDIDMDGRPDQISFAGQGSGFLALDRNGDGVVNDGSELFGAATGNGFCELAAFDSDGNGWIDENDPIFSGLRIWTKDEDGNDRLFALGEVGVGAIYLGHNDTPYQFKDRGGDLQGVMRASGMFLFEDGRAGTMHQIDLAQ